VRFVDISSQLHGFQPPRLIREEFRSRSELADYLERSSPGADIRVPSIDWGHREAILVAAGPRSSTGYRLRVVGVRETPHHVEVTVHEDTPQLGAQVVARVTYPFRLITIPRIDKPLHLHWPGRP
jgi:hypothetical protein